MTRRSALILRDPATFPPPGNVTGGGIVFRGPTKKGVLNRHLPLSRPGPMSIERTPALTTNEGMSTRAIAPAVGVSKDTVQRDRQVYHVDTPEPPAPSGSTLTPATCMTQAVAYASQSREGYRSN